jgi:4-carboxymuconolactone decarboxylase
MTDRYTQGEATRRQVLGDAHVNRSQANATPLDAPFQHLITEAAWGHVWSSDALTRRERSMVTLALLAGLGNWEEFELHLRATANTGATPQDIAQVLQHVAIYAGVPRANSAMKIAKAMLAEREETR